MEGGIIKAAQSKSSAKNYQRRKNRQDRMLPELSEQYKKGEIDFDYYKKFLVGAKRHKAETEDRVR